MDKPRPGLAIAICMGLFLAFMYFNAPNEAERQAQDRRRAEQAERRAEQIEGEGLAAPVGVPRGAAVNGEPGRGDQPKEEPRSDRPVRPARQHELTSDLLRIKVDSSRGAGLREVILPEHRSSDPPLEEGLELAPLVLLPALENERPALAFSVDEMGPDLASLQRVPVSLGDESWDMKVGGDEDTTKITFSNIVDESGTADAKGVAIERELTFFRHERHVNMLVTLTNRGDRARAIAYRLQGPSGARSESTRAAGSDINAIFGQLVTNGPPTVELKLAGSLTEGVESMTKNAAYVGIQNNYFTSLLAPVRAFGAPEELQPTALASEVTAQAFPERSSVHMLAEKEFPGRRFEDLSAAQLHQIRTDAIRTARTSLAVRDVLLQPGESVTHSYICLFSDRNKSHLTRYGSLNFNASNDYGMTTWIVTLFIGILDTFHSVVGSWGLAIVCLTLLVRFALHPINRKQQAGMMRYQKKIAKIQPQINELKEKFKDDKMTMNQEMQKLFKENNINPAQMMGGCMMIFLQLPIWIGLITTLDFAIQLRQKPFMGWIEDLTQPDRLFVFDHTIWWLPTALNLLPILYVGLMLVQQRLQPKATDPQAAQTQKTMSIVMIAFGFIFYSFASGLLIYFLVSAIFGIIESKLIKAKLAREEDASGAVLATADGPSGGPAGALGGGSALYGSSKAVSKKKKPKKQKWPM